MNSLVYCMGDEADDILTSFSLSDADKKRYSIVTGKFQGHFVKKKNVVYEQAQFHKRRQKEGETVDEFITALYQLVEHCQYGDLRDECIRDQIVIGILDSHLSLKLQLDDTLTLEKAIGMCRQSESVKGQQKTLRGGDAVTTGTVDAIGLKKFPPRQGTVNPSNQPFCTRCGKGPAHPRQQCPANEAVCHRCRKKGTSKHTVGLKMLWERLRLMGPFWVLKQMVPSWEQSEPTRGLSYGLCC